MKSKKVIILGIPSCFGGNILGCDLGPRYIRKYLLPLLKKQKVEFVDKGNINVPPYCTMTDPHEKCIKEIKEIYKNLENNINKKKIFENSNFPILLGGDHSINLPFIKASAQKHKKLGLIWLDAHGDFNTPEISPSGNVHGMVLASLAGLGPRKSIISQENICILGVRELDPQEKKLLQKTKITVITMKQIKKTGIKKALQKAIEIASNKTNGFHVSIDLDVFDPTIAPGVGTPVKGGLKKNDLQEITKILKGRPKSLDVVELYPSQDKQNKTSKLAAKLIQKLILPRI